MREFRNWWEKHRASTSPHTCQSARGENLAMLADEEIWRAACEWLLKVKKQGNCLTGRDAVLTILEKELGNNEEVLQVFYNPNYPVLDKCQSCIKLNEAIKSYKIPSITISVDGMPEYCRKCYQDERAKVANILTLLKEAKMVRTSGMLFNDKYTVEAGLDKICELISYVLAPFKPKPKPTKLELYRDYSYYVGTEITCKRMPMKYSAWIDGRKEGGE